MVDSVHVNFFRRDGKIQYTFSRKIPGNGFAIYRAPSFFLTDWNNEHGLDGLIAAGDIALDSKEHFGDGDKSLGYRELYVIHDMFESVGYKVKIK
jgi:hypothetical protein